MGSERTWIAVTERLPKLLRYVLVYSYGDGPQVAFRLSGTTAWALWECRHGTVCDVTHWVPLPPKPRKRR